jgi:hypothetical protein
MPSSLVQLRAIKKKAPGSDAKFFTTNRKGENHELREELRSPDRNRKRDAVKKVRFPSRRWSLILSLQVIANMTVGKDVSTLFTDVVNCIQTGERSFFPAICCCPHTTATARQSGVEEIGLSLLDQLRQVPTRPGDACCQHLCERCQRSCMFPPPSLLPFSLSWSVESSDPSSCHPHHGLHSSEHHHRVFV